MANCVVIFPLDMLALCLHWQKVNRCEKWTRSLAAAYEHGGARADNYSRPDTILQ